MKNFKKKAIFAALMGALSSVSSFAMENEKKSKKSKNIERLIMQIYFNTKISVRTKELCF